MRKTKQGTLNDYLWKELVQHPASPAAKYLKRSMSNLGLNQLWDTPIGHITLKRLVQKTINFGMVPDDMPHLLCSCDKLLEDRKNLLNYHFIRCGILSRRQAVLACFAPHDPQLNCSLVRFMKTVEKKTPSLDS